MNQVTVQESGQTLTFTIDDLMRYHGPGFPGGVAHGLKALEAALPLLEDGEPIERRELSIRTAFPGPGARDVFELVARTWSDNRYVVDASLADADTAEEPDARYVFHFSYRGQTAVVKIRPGHVRREFIALGQKTQRTPAEEKQLARMKQEMADRLLARDGAEIYDAGLMADA
ncbi:MAG: hypothetical protein ACX931_04225 [Saccharospirillum sp.]